VVVDGLFRSRSDRMIGGLAGGIGRATGVDSTLIRVGWVILAFVTQGAAVLLYFVLLFVIPEQPGGTAGDAGVTEPVRVAGGPGGPNPAAAAGEPEPRPTQMPSQLPLVLGIALIAVGAWYLVRQFLPPIDLGALWPVIAVALGAVLVVASLARR
jgi:phage shock protein PspC (stress-responsive transcriptional regulator)